jgi:hypothetical protein
MKTEYIHYLYYTLLYSLYTLYVITILNLAYFKSVTTYLPLIQDGLKYFVILFLLIRFNPYTNEKFTEFDKKIIFSSSIFLLSTTVVSDALLSYFDNNIGNKIGITTRVLQQN